MVAVSSILPRAHIHHIHRCSGNLLLHSPFARNGWRMCCENLSMRDVCFTEGRSSSGPWTCPSLVRTHLGILSLLNGDIDHVGGDFSDIIVSSFIMCIYIDILTYVLFISYSLTPFAFKLQFIGDFMAQAAQGRCCQGGDISTRDCSWPRSLLLRAIILFQKLPIFLLGSPCWIFFKGWWGILTPKNGGPFRKTKEFVWGQL